MAVALSSSPTGRLGTPEGKLLNYLDLLEQEGQWWRARAHKEADLYERMFHGKRRIGDSTPPRFRANIVGPTVSRRDALLTENKPLFKIEPLADGLTSTAEVLNELVDFAWQDYAFPAAIEDMADMAAVFGAAGFSLPYDFEAAGGFGSVVPTVRDPRSIMIDPGIARAAEIGRKAKYTMVETVECIWDLQHDFPGRGMLVKPERGISGVIPSPSSGNTAIQTQGTTSWRDYLQKLQEGPIPRARKKVFFLRDPARTPEGDLRWPQGRSIVRAGEVILDDSPAPFWDGEPDLVWFDNRRDFTSVWGHSEVEALRYIQGAINRIGEMFVNNTVLMGNSRVIADTDAFGNDILNRLNNAEALVITKRRQTEVRWEPPPTMPPHFLQFISFALRLVDYLIGLSDGGLEGRGRVEMRSGVQLEGLQNAAQVLIRKLARQLETFVEQVGRKFISRIFQFMTRDRVLLGTGPGQRLLRYKFEADRFEAEIKQIAQAKVDKDGGQLSRVILEERKNAARQFAFRVQPLSSLAQTKVARATLLMQLVEGAMLPRKIVLQETGFTNADELIQQATQERMQMAQMGIQPEVSKKSSSKKKAVGI